MDVWYQAKAENKVQLNATYIKGSKNDQKNLQPGGSIETIVFTKDSLVYYIKLWLDSM